MQASGRRLEFEVVTWLIGFYQQFRVVRFRQSPTSAMGMGSRNATAIPRLDMPCVLLACHVIPTRDIFGHMVFPLNLYDDIRRIGWTARDVASQTKVQSVRIKPPRFEQGQINLLDDTKMWYTSRWLGSCKVRGKHTYSQP